MSAGSVLRLVTVCVRAVVISDPGTMSATSATTKINHMKKKYKSKKAMAISMMSNVEKLKGTAPFLSRAWLGRQDRIAERVERKQGDAYKRAVVRKIKSKMAKNK